MEPTINLADYAISLLRRASTGVLVPVRPGVMDGWAAREHQCHKNAHEWCERNSGHSPVPGWLYFDFGGYFDYVRFTAHTVVRAHDNELRDITPSQASQPYPFIAAAESQDLYDEVVERHKVVHLDLYSDGRTQVFVAGDGGAA